MIKHEMLESRQCALKWSWRTFNTEHDCYTTGSFVSSLRDVFQQLCISQCCLRTVLQISLVGAWCHEVWPNTDARMGCPFQQYSWRLPVVYAMLLSYWETGAGFWSTNPRRIYGLNCLVPGALLRKVNLSNQAQFIHTGQLKLEHTFP